VRKVYKTTFETAPEGAYPAWITTVADLGVQRSSYQGKERVSEKLGITFELATEKAKDGRAFAVFDTVTFSFNEKSRLYEIAKAALGKAPEDLDPAELVGKPVLVTVIHRSGPDGKVWANVERVTPVPKGLKVPPTKTPLLTFDLERPDPEVFQKLPALFRKRIEDRVKTEKAEPEDSALEDVPY
jgi:hypothetical protein